MRIFRTSKTAFISVLVVASASIAATAVVSINEVNKKVETLLAPLNNNNTEMNFVFTRLAVNEARATDFGFKANILKKGLKNQVELSAPSVEYTYGDGKNPTAKIDLALKLDVIKVFGQETINMFSESLEEMVIDNARSFTNEYGAAVSITANVLDKKSDANGNVTSVKMTVSAQFDLSKLPASKPVSDAELKSIELEILGDRNGFKLSANLVLNPEYRRFTSGDVGLKEYIERLLAEDQDTYMELGQALAFVDMILFSLAETEAQ